MQCHCSTLAHYRGSPFNESLRHYTIKVFYTFLQLLGRFLSTRRPPRAGVRRRVRRCISTAPARSICATDLLSLVCKTLHDGHRRAPARECTDEPAHGLRRERAGRAIPLSPGGACDAFPQRRATHTTSRAASWAVPRAHLVLCAAVLRVGRAPRRAVRHSPYGTHRSALTVRSSLSRRLCRVCSSADSHADTVTQTQSRRPETGDRARQSALPPALRLAARCCGEVL